MSAISLKHPPHSHFSTPLWNTLRSRSAQSMRLAQDAGESSSARSSTMSAESCDVSEGLGEGTTRVRSRALGASTPRYRTPLKPLSGTMAARRPMSSVGLSKM